MICTYIYIITHIQQFIVDWEPHSFFYSWIYCFLLANFLVPIHEFLLTCRFIFCQNYIFWNFCWRETIVWFYRIIFWSTFIFWIFCWRESIVWYLSTYFLANFYFLKFLFTSILNDFSGKFFGQLLYYLCLISKIYYNIIHNNRNKINIIKNCVRSY